ncbi:hypothetical protein IG631_17565 [Alternaria alternata]|nr:hypothetical protein IG631_17565 [Alternaria alternata]
MEVFRPLLTSLTGGVFKLELFLPDDYPMTPPKGNGQYNAAYVVGLYSFVASFLGRRWKLFRVGGGKARQRYLPPFVATLPASLPTTLLPHPKDTPNPLLYAAVCSASNSIGVCSSRPLSLCRAVMTAPQADDTQSADRRRWP